jgi:thymidylate synthase (FAD)
MVTMNARELMHFFALRCCNRAQAEIREAADLMLAEVQKVSPQIFRDAGPACVRGPCPEGELTCGKPRRRGRQ